MKLYGEVFEFLSEPIGPTDDITLVDATERKIGQTTRVHIPLPIVNMANRQHNAASCGFNFWAVFVEKVWH